MLERMSYAHKTANNSSKTRANPRLRSAVMELGFPSRCDMSCLSVTTIELVVTTVESVRDSKSERTSLLKDTIVRVKL
jgi:hypothetical protein